MIPGLLLSKNDLLAKSVDSPDVNTWFEIYKLLNLNVTLIDRCDHVVMPFHFKNDFPMVRDLDGFNKTYMEVAVERARSLIAHSKAINKPIVILYSGGIDSTLVVISFLLADREACRDITVAMNSASLRENPRFYQQHVRKHFRLTGSEKSLDLLDGNWVMVGGEFNDQLFGSDIYRNIIDFGGIEYLFQPYTERNVTAFFEHVGISAASAKAWYDLVDQQIKATRLCEIVDVKDFFWWLNFCFKWQSVYYRIVARSTYPGLLTREFLDQHYHQFYLTEDFQRWSMLNPDKKIGNTWQSHKKIAKEAIYEFTRDQDYYDYKTKHGSLSGVFRQRAVPDALDEAYQKITLTDAAVYYQPENSFREYLDGRI